MFNQQESVEGYIYLIVRNLGKLITHYYTAKAQAKYLKERKQDLENETALCWVIMQKITDSFSRRKCRGFIGIIVSAPFILLSFTALKKTHWFIDPIALYQLTAIIMLHLFTWGRKLSLITLYIPRLKTIEYFSDGCGTQYQNRSNFLNLCMHKKDVKVCAKLNFFATIYGKQPCDGVGGTVERPVAKLSL